MGSLGQVNAQEGWSFELDAVNLGNTAATARVAFTDQSGNPLLMPLTFPQLPATGGPELAATLDRTINPNARVVINSSGSAAEPVGDRHEAIDGAPPKVCIAGAREVGPQCPCESFAARLPTHRLGEV